MAESSEATLYDFFVVGWDLAGVQRVVDDLIDADLPRSRDNPRALYGRVEDEVDQLMRHARVLRPEKGPDSSPWNRAQEWATRLLNDSEKWAGSPKHKQLFDFAETLSKEAESGQLEYYAALTNAAPIASRYGLTQKLLSFVHECSLEGENASILGQRLRYLWEDVQLFGEDISPVGLAQEYQVILERACRLGLEFGTGSILPATYHELRAEKEKTATDAGDYVTWFHRQRLDPWREAIHLGLSRRSALATSEPEVDTARAGPYVFRRDGEIWQLEYEDERTNLPDSKGLCYISELLRQPGSFIGASVLVNEFARSNGLRADVQTGTADESTGSDSPPPTRPKDSSGSIPIGPTEKRKIRADYRAILSELKKAEEDGNITYSDELKDKFHKLADRIADLDERESSRKERDRKSVRNRITDAKKKFGERCPKLAKHLDDAIDTGFACVYRRELALDWEL